VSVRILSSAFTTFCNCHLRCNYGSYLTLKKGFSQEVNHKRLQTLETKLRVAGWEVDGGWARWVMGIKKGTGYDEHWVLYVSDESLNSTKTNITLYVNELEFK